MKHFSTRDAARILETSEAHVRAYARLGQIVPQRGPGRRLEFSFQELVLLRTTKGLMDSGVPARRMRRIWSSLRRQLADDLPLTSVTIFADGERAIAWDGNARWRPDSGQFLLNFDTGEIAARAGIAGPEATPLAVVAAARSESSDPPADPPELVLVGSRSAPPDEPRAGGRDGRNVGGTRGSRPDPDDVDRSLLTAEQWFHLGCELEDSSPVEARQAYTQAIEADPGFADAQINLGRQYHEIGELGKAEAHYRDAVRSAPADPTGHFNLGVLLEDRGRPDEAIHAYEQAIARDPDLADAHYNLGLLLESLGKRPDAIRHLMRARQVYEDDPPT